MMVLPGLPVCCATMPAAAKAWAHVVLQVMNGTILPLERSVKQLPARSVQLLRNCCLR